MEKSLDDKLQIIVGVYSCPFYELGGWRKGLQILTLRKKQSTPLKQSVPCVAAIWEQFLQNLP